MRPGGTRDISQRPRTPGPFALAAAALALLVGGCGGRVPPENRPDEVLRAQFGLTDQDEVHRVTLTGTESESLDPAQNTVPAGAWVEFITGDGWIHEVRFEADSLSAGARNFLERTDQMSSPPLVNRGQRFVVSFRDAPEGRYPFLAEGNGGMARGVVVVRSNR